ncbi:outer membrane beta-barrel protein [Chryseosolibacter indicus]|uniref:Outer membrane protein beta-barrel domain-containing protein n=1 Tax=Chryseosolibacter indicus TaxID=2782351 RepID=A0ABS5VUA8_9BACT|nr:outer membrane beta-barrel protein [Chryseosolibacter indicus]MBT1704474.1 hypothetical protein [Chryseosolibacter indicus]
MFKGLLIRTLLLAITFHLLHNACAQTKIASFGIYSGITSTYTWDEGINADPRYNTRYDIKTSPIGLTYSLDFRKYGFMLSTGLLNTGQNFNVFSSSGSQAGLRKINLLYAHLPIVFKFHLIDLSALTTSFIIGISPAYLVKGKETITHRETSLYFPPIVYSILPPDYIVQSNGVLAPQQNNYIIAEKSDFNSLQFFGLLGLHSDWYFSSKWKLSIDVTANYGALDNRSSSYRNVAKTYNAIYNLPGTRRDIVGTLAVGIARHIELEASDKARPNPTKKNNKKPSQRKYRTSKQKRPD